MARCCASRERKLNDSAGMGAPASAAVAARSWSLRATTAKLRATRYTGLARPVSFGCGRCTMYMYAMLSFRHVLPISPSRVLRRYGKRIKRAAAYAAITPGIGGRCVPWCNRTTEIATFRVITCRADETCARCGSKHVRPTIASDADRDIRKYLDIHKAHFLSPAAVLKSMSNY